MNSACSTQELKRKEIQDQCKDYGGGGVVSEHVLVILLIGH